MMLFLLLLFLCWGSVEGESEEEKESEKASRGGACVRLEWRKDKN